MVLFSNAGNSDFSPKTAPPAVQVAQTTKTAAVNSVTSVSTSQSNTMDWMNADLQKNYTYFKNNLSGQGRVYSANYGGTISEGQSYLMLQSMYMDDLETFDKAWQWTKNNLQTRPNDSLLSWRWGWNTGEQTPKVIYRENATDADQDVAYSLLKASEKWNNPQYKQDALKIIKDLWKTNVFEQNGKYYLDPGDWEGFDSPNAKVLNPSYLAPYVYREFAKIDTEHAAGWKNLAQTSYEVIEQSSKLNPKGLPPNFVALDKQGNIVKTEAQGSYSSDFSYDAFRVFWRMTTDAAEGSTTAKEWLKNHQTLLTELQKNGTLPQGYGPGGNPLGENNSGYTLSAAVTQAAVVNGPEAAQALYNKHIKPLQNNDNGSWVSSTDYYPNTVMWLNLHSAKLLAENAGAQDASPPMSPQVTIPTTPVSSSPTLPLPYPQNIGSSLETIKMLLQQATPHAYADAHIDSAELQAAWQKTNDPILKEVLGKLDYYVRQYNKPLTTTDLAVLAGNKGYIAITDAELLPKKLNW